MPPLPDPAADAVLWVVPTPVGLDECWALDTYSRPPDGLTRVAELFNRAKYHGLGPPLMALRTMFGARIAGVASFRHWPRDIAIVPVGSSSELAMSLAAAASASLDAPVIEFFRPPAGPKLKGIPVRSRAAVAPARLVLRGRRECPPNVVLVDDLVESGATMSAAAVALRRLGATRVFGMAAVHIHH